MERIWRLYRNRQPDGDRHQQDPAVFHVHITSHLRFPNNYLSGSCILAQYPQVHLGCEEKSVVLPLN